MDHDGFCFIPDNDGNFDVAFFKAKSDNGAPVGGTAIGEMYHIAFFKDDENGVPYIDDMFEAILGDPMQYISNLVGSNLYGIFLRKTENSTEWFKDYVTLIMANMDEFKQRMME